MAGRPLLWLGAVMAAGLCGAQAVSNVGAKRAPEAAAMLSPYGAESVQRQAIRSLRSQTNEREIIRDPGTLAVARKALSRSLLMTEAAGVAGLSVADPARRETIFDAAQHLSHRGRILQGALFQYHAENGDLAGALRDLDHLYRAYPDTAAIVMPVLADFFAREGSDAAFAEILRTDPAWADAFFRETAGREGLIVRLAELRIELGEAVRLQPQTDQLLAGSLVRAGKAKTGFAIYDAFLAPREGKASRRSSRLDWSTAHPPFGWQLADDYGFRARVEGSGQGIAVTIRPGRGGIFAERLIALRPEASALLIEADFARGERLFARLSCPDAPDLAVEVPLDRRKVRLELPDGAACPVARISLAGRAWSTGSAISGTVRSVRIVTE